MAFNAKHAELIAEIAALHRLQMGANRRAALGGWTRQSEAWHEMRAARIALLHLQLAALDANGAALYPRGTSDNGST
jgi:hypothetical protein